MNIKVLVCGLSTIVLSASAAEWTAREMSVDKVDRHPSGTIASVDLSFGADNGLTNNLYVAWGAEDGGNRIGGWEHWKILGKVTAETNVFHAVVPTASCCRFFLDVPFGEGVFGVPLKAVVGDGSAYLNTGISLMGKDVVKVTFQPDSTANGGVVGTRQALNVANKNVVMSAGKFLLDHSGDSSKSDNYESYRLVTDSYSTAGIYDIELSSARRRVYSQTGEKEIGCNDTTCPDEFTTISPCWLFKVSNSPAVLETGKGKVFAFTIVRDGDPVASYLPYRFGEVCGFFDRVTGVFHPATVGAFSGVEDATAVTPLTSVTELLEKGEPTDETLPRAISAVRIENENLVVTFGADNGVVNRMFLAYGMRDGGELLEGWEHYQEVGRVDGEVNSSEVQIPKLAKRCRIFLYLPFEGDVPPIQLQYLTGDGSGYFETGFKGRGGDDITIRVRASGSNSEIFGCRSSTVNDRDLAFYFTGERKFQIDYTNSEYGRYRMVSSVASSAVWYDLKASPSERSAVNVATGETLGDPSTTVCLDEFETAYDCRLFDVSGYAVLPNLFAGDIASLKVVRNGKPFVIWQPCRKGEVNGFVDLVGGGFKTAATGTFVGPADSSVSRLAAVSELLKVNQAGLLLLFR